jgi:hypothetical protein
VTRNYWFISIDPWYGTARQAIHLQFDINANALEIRTVQSPKCYTPDVLLSILSLAINTVTLKNKKILHLNFESVIFIRLFIVFSHYGANILYNILRY